MADANDLYANRIVIPGSGGSFDYDTAGATYEAGEFFSYPSLWYEFTPDTSGDWACRTLDDTTTYMVLWSTAAGTALNQLAYVVIGVSTTLTLPGLVAGTTYMLSLIDVGPHGAGTFQVGKLAQHTLDVQLFVDPVQTPYSGPTSVVGSDPLNDASDATYLEFVGNGTDQAVLLTSEDLKVDLVPGEEIVAVTAMRLHHRETAWGYGQRVNDSGRYLGAYSWAPKLLGLQQVFFSHSELTPTSVGAPTHDTAGSYFSYRMPEILSLLLEGGTLGLILATGTITVTPSRLDAADPGSPYTVGAVEDRLYVGDVLRYLLVQYEIDYTVFAVPGEGAANPWVLGSPAW